MWHVHAVAETHEILVVPFLTVDNKPTAVELVDTVAAVRRSGRPAAADVKDEISRAISQEIRQVRVVLAVGVRVLDVQLHVYCKQCKWSIHALTIVTASFSISERVENV